MPATGLPPALHALAETSAAPPAVAAALEWMIDGQPGLDERLVADPALAGGLVAVLGASRSLGRFCQSHPAALEVLAHLDDRPPLTAEDRLALQTWKQLELLRLAARDLTGLDSLEAVGEGLAALADDVLGAALGLAGADRATRPPAGPGNPAGMWDDGWDLTVVAMGKLGARELNYASDIDIVFVAPDGVGQISEVTQLARQVVEVVSRCFRVDLDLRPEGRSGALVRTLASYQAYWKRWAGGWERQALLKARPAAGDPTLGKAFAQAAAETVWGQPFGTEEIREARDMKSRTEVQLARQGLTDREVKRGRGGIRDVEFAVQLLQLVHGRADPAIRQPSTLAALGELARAGYVSATDAAALEGAYRFLRAVEHRLQLVEERPVRSVPTEAGPRTALARNMGFRDDPSATATARFDEELTRRQAEARTVHERLFFRPLLEAFAILPPEQGRLAPTLSEVAVSERLAAFGFKDAARTRAALDELTRGLTRSSRLMAQVLALVLAWLSEEPDPDLGLLGLRRLTDSPHRRDLVVSTFRESPEAARRLCRLVGTSRPLHELLRQEPGFVRALADDQALALPDRQELVERCLAGLSWRNESSRPRRLLQLKRLEWLRIATRDLLGYDGPSATAIALTTLAEAVIEVALAAVEPPVPLAVIAMGRLGGSELSYASDLDILLVCGSGDDSARTDAQATALLRLVNGATPAERIFTVDTQLRPEGRHGLLAPTLAAYRTYYEGRARTWERQALVRARPIAGDPQLGQAFMELIDQFVWGRPAGEEEVREIRRMKARVERERLPRGEDPEFHLKLGPGALADVEWTAQLLQLVHGVRSPGTMAALEALAAAGALSGGDERALAAAYRQCERIRNRWALMGGRPADALPLPADQLARLAHSLGSTASELRAGYRRVTRRARRVVEHRFYGMP